jgi:hypothetical protein
MRWIPGGFSGRGLRFGTESGRLNKVTIWVSWKAQPKLRELGWAPD